jgi:hypothetical protein
MDAFPPGLTALSLLGFRGEAGTVPLPQGLHAPDFSRRLAALHSLSIAGVDGFPAYMCGSSLRRLALADVPCDATSCKILGRYPALRELSMRTWDVEEGAAGGAVFPSVTRLEIGLTRPCAQILALQAAFPSVIDAALGDLSHEDGSEAQAEWPPPPGPVRWRGVRRLACSVPALPGNRLRLLELLGGLDGELLALSLTAVYQGEEEDAGEDFSDAQLAALLAAVPSLRRLSLDGECALAAGLRALPPHPALRRLSLRFSDVARVDAEGLAALGRSLPGLRRLSIVAYGDSVELWEAWTRQLDALSGGAPAGDPEDSEEGGEALGDEAFESEEEEDKKEARRSENGFLSAAAVRARRRAQGSLLAAIRRAPQHSAA